MMKIFFTTFVCFLALTHVNGQNDFFPISIHYDPWTAHNANAGVNFGEFNPENYDYYLQQIKDCGINTIGTARIEDDYLFRVSQYGFRVWNRLSQNDYLHNYIHRGFQEIWPIGFDDEIDEYETHLSLNYYDIYDENSASSTYDTLDGGLKYFYFSNPEIHDPGYVLKGYDDATNSPRVVAGSWRSTTDFYLSVFCKVDSNTSGMNNPAVATFHVYEIMNESLNQTEGEQHSFSLPESNTTPAAQVEKTIYYNDFETIGQWDTLHFDVGIFHAKSKDYPWVTYVDMEWHGNTGFYIDKFELRSTRNYDLFVDEDSLGTFTEIENTFQDYSQVAGGQYDILDRYYYDEPLFNQYHSFGKVDDLAFDGTGFSIAHATMSNFVKGIKRYRYFDFVNPQEIIYNNYVFNGPYYSDNQLDMTHNSDDRGEASKTLQQSFNRLIRNIAEINTLNTDNIPFVLTIEVQKEVADSANENGDSLRFRDPLPSEILAQGWIGIAHGVKGVYYFLYSTGQFGEIKFKGLVDIIHPVSGDTAADPYDPRLGKYVPNEKWVAVQELNRQLNLLAPDLLNLSWQNAYLIPEDETGHEFQIDPDDRVVDSVVSEEYPEKPYIQVGHLQHTETDEHYVVLANRRSCIENDGECPGYEGQTVTVSLDIEEPMLLEDVLASREPWNGSPYNIAYRRVSPENSTFTIYLEPGQGRLFRLTESLQGHITEDRYYSGELLVDGDLSFKEYATLTVYPGTQIKFTENSGFNFQGGASMRLAGIIQNPITFLPENPGGSWKGLWILDAPTDTCVISHTDIINASIGLLAFADFSTNSQRRSIDPPVTDIKQININHSSFLGGNVGLFTRNYPNVDINNSTFNFNSYYGGLFESSDVSMNNCSIQTNHLGGLYSFDSYMDIKDTQIKNNGVNTESGAGVKGAYFSNVSIYHEIENPECLNNHNEIIGNKNGLVISNGSEADLGVYDQNDPNSRYGYNEIYNNIDFEIQTESFVNAQLTFWDEELASDYPAIGKLQGNINVVPPAPLEGDSLCDDTPVSPDSLFMPDDWYEIYLSAKQFESEQNYLSALQHYHELALWAENESVNRIGVKGIDRVSKKSGGLNEAIQNLEELISQLNHDDALFHANERVSVNRAYSGEIEDGLDIIHNLLAMDNNEADEARLLYRQSVFLEALGQVSKIANEYQQGHIADQYPTTSTAALIEVNALMSGQKRRDEENEKIIPKTFQISSLAPNPFNPNTTLIVILPKIGNLSIHIYDISGRLVRIIDTGIIQAGQKEITWDGRNTNGEDVATGLYIFKPLFKSLEGEWLTAESRKGILLK